MFTIESGKTRRREQRAGSEAASYRCDSADVSVLADGVHSPACSIWDTPEPCLPEALLETGIEDEAIIAYVAAVSPLYEAARRCTGQLSGVLLLLQTDSLDKRRDGLLLASVAGQLQEASDRLRAVKPPAHALRHHAMLADLMVLLGRILKRFDRLCDLRDPASPDLDAVVAALFSTQQALLSLSEPRAGLMPVDFKAACCNCRKLKN